MTCSNESQISTELQDTISNFLVQYGASGLKQALQLYKDSQQEYICRTKTSLSKIHISDIYYMEIQEHQITIYTQHGNYHKYGTLNNELKSLSSYGFIKCAQNRIVSLGKIRSICFNDIILINGIKIHMSKKYAISIISEFSKCKKQL
ncbi:LytTR family DNA-binding domain-containing protein [Lachnospiraceae bacterium 48-42]